MQRPAGEWIDSAIAKHFAIVNFPIAAELAHGQHFIAITCSAVAGNGARGIDVDTDALDGGNQTISVHIKDEWVAA